MRGTMRGQTNTIFPFIEESWIFDEYRKVFPHYTPPIFVQEQMLVNIADRSEWSKTCRYWGLNDYRPSSVGKMMEYYNDQLRLKANSQVGRSLPVDDVIENCRRCFDSGTILQPVPQEERKTRGSMEQIPCPECAEVTV